MGSPGCRRSKAKPRQAQVQGLSDRLLPYRHRRGSNRAGQALPPRRHRPDLEVRLRRAAREGDAPHRGRLPAPPHRSRPLQGPHRAHRQRNPLHRRQATRGSAAPEIKEALATGELFRAHAFEYACAQHDIDHRLTKPKHPWTNGQVERMNRTIKDATVKRFFYEPTISCDAISPTSSPPTTSPDGSRPSRASPPTSSSAKPGLQSRNDSPSTRSSKCRDWTSSAGATSDELPPQN